MSATLDIRIRGKDYQVACTEEERPTLEAAVTLLNRRMDEIAARTRGTGERLAVMAALNLAYDVIAHQSGKPLSERADDGIDAASAKRRIAAIEAKLDAALKEREQNDLFAS